MATRKHHPLALEIRARLKSSRSQWERIAKRAGVTPRSLRALADGQMHEMTVTRELALAEALGVTVEWRAK